MKLYSYHQIPDRCLTPPDPKPYVCPLCRDEYNAPCVLEQGYSIGEECTADLGDIVLRGDIKGLVRFLQTVAYNKLESPYHTPTARNNDISRIADVLRELADHIDALRSR
jgi:hypothetical protein